jgi:CubicO group peptidase (beta-lactamase class C family)
MNSVVRRLRPFLAVLLVAASLVACSDDDGGGSGASAADGAGSTTTTSTAASTATTTTVVDQDWRVDAPEDHDMDPVQLEAAKAYAFADGMNTQGVVVVRGGAIVAEWYGPGADADSWAASWSMSKSVASALIGIAIGDGKIPSVDEPMTTWYPDWAQRGLGDVTLRDVLEMSPGLQWNESYDPPTSRRPT